MVQKVMITIILSTAVLMAESVIYEVEPYQNYNDSAEYVQQTFVATTDTITSLWFFIGRSPGEGSYILEIEGISGAQKYVGDDGSGWKWIGGNVDQAAPVTKGKTYTLRVYHSGDFLTNFYYSPDVYAPGSLKTPDMPNNDLAARV